MTVTLVWAQSRNGVIGANGVLPWHLPEDLAHFRALTAGGVVLMGRATWESLPERFRPLPERTNIVLTRTLGWHERGAITAKSLDDALGVAGGRDVWVIGGREVFDQVVGRADALEVTEINADFAGDTSAPEIRAEWVADRAETPGGWKTSETGLDYRFLRYTRSTSEG